MRIKEMRIAAKITQDELAKAVGVTQSAVAAWEREEYLPSTPIIPALAKALSVKIGDLFDDE